MDKVLIELLQATKEERQGRGNNALQELRNAFGFDYNKPIKAVKFRDSFTATTLKNLYEIDCKTGVVAVIFHKATCFKVAKFTDGVVNILDNASFYTLTHFWTKAEFGEKRKDGWHEVYVVYQKFEFTISPRHRRDSWRDLQRLEANERYIAFNPENENSGVVKYGMNRKWENRIEVTFTPETFDKSGYPVYLKRAKLNKKAKDMKAQKQAQAYKDMTNTKDMIEKVKKAINLKKIELSSRLLDCNNSQEIEKICDAISYNGLKSCYYEIERIEEKDNEKMFASPDDFNSSIAWIYTKLSRI